MERWAHGSLLLVAVGSVANLLLAFVPNLLDDRITTALVIAMSLLLVGLGAALTVRLLRREMARAELQRLRGISKVGHTHGTDQFAGIFRAAERTILCCGIGMTRISRSPSVVEQAVARGVRVHFVMPEPRWLRWDRTGRRLTGLYYDRARFDARVGESYSALAAISRDLNTRFGNGSVTIHTHRMFMPVSVTVADPGTTRAIGIIEHHYFGGTSEARFWLEAKHCDSANGNPAILEIVVAAISQLANHDFTSGSELYTGRSPR
ncbi:hypothetical protein ACFWEJ_22505 [Promicromonospora sp. NPDC060204]|uniref:hypothetical protein n=1 Tax=Promicromonospora sp. NPDC060204 TaxID=3347071 RepID=UPI00364EA8B2